MTHAYEDDDLPLPLLRRSTPRSESVAEIDLKGRRDYREGRTGDRMRPATAGGLTGLLAGAAGLGVVHAMHLTRMDAGIARLGAAWGAPADAALPLAYLAAALGGAMVGAIFALVTRHLRRFVPLVIWALIFFGSLTMLALAASVTYGRGFGISMAPAILAATAAFAFVASFQLPLRRRGGRPV